MNHPDVFVAIVSGRGVNNVKSMVGIDGITYAGNHGLEILHPDGTKFVHPMPESAEADIKELIKKLTQEVCTDGAWVENKGVLLTYHYREVPVDKREDLIAGATRIIQESGFKVSWRSKKVGLLVRDSSLLIADWTGPLRHRVQAESRVEQGPSVALHYAHGLRGRLE